MRFVVRGGKRRKRKRGCEEGKRWTHETKEVGVVRRNQGRGREAMWKRTNVEITQGGEVGRRGGVRGRLMENLRAGSVKRKMRTKINSGQPLSTRLRQIISNQIQKTTGVKAKGLGGQEGHEGGRR